MIPLKEFEYFEPITLEEAISLLTVHGKDSIIQAGGTDIIPLMKRKLITPKYIVNIGMIPLLKYIQEVQGNGIRIGALTTIDEISKSTLIREKCPILIEATENFATPQVRNLATLGGNICRASPAGDMILPLLVMDARIKTLGSTGERIIALADFFKGPGINALTSGEILTEVDIPHQSFRFSTSFVKLKRTGQDLAKINVAVAIALEEDIVKDVRIALGAVAPTPIRALKAEAFFRGKKYSETTLQMVSKIAGDEARPITDLRSSADYRKYVVGILVKNALKKTLEV